MVLKRRARKPRKKVAPLPKHKQKFTSREIPSFTLPIFKRVSQIWGVPITDLAPVYKRRLRLPKKDGILNISRGELSVKKKKLIKENYLTEAIRHELMHQIQSLVFPFNYLGKQILWDPSYLFSSKKITEHGKKFRRTKDYAILENATRLATDLALEGKHDIALLLLVNPPKTPNLITKENISTWLKAVERAGIISEEKLTRKGISFLRKQVQTVSIRERLEWQRKRRASWLQTLTGPNKSADQYSDRKKFLKKKKQERENKN